MEWITIYNMRLAGKLMTQGFVLMGVGQSKTDYSKKVFYFKDTPALRELLEQSIQETKSKSHTKV